MCFLVNAIVCTTIRASLCYEDVHGREAAAFGKILFFEEEGGRRVTFFPEVDVFVIL